MLADVSERFALVRPHAMPVDTSSWPSADRPFGLRFAVTPFSSRATADGTLDTTGPHGDGGDDIKPDYRDDEGMPA